MPLHQKIRRYFHILKIVLKALILQRRGLPERVLNNYFDEDELENLNPVELFDLITDKAGFEYVHVSYGTLFC